VLTGAEIKVLVETLSLRERTLVLLAASTGLRQEEFFGLKWHDIDFERETLFDRLSVVSKPLQDRILTEAGSDASTTRGSIDRVENAMQIQNQRRLSIRQSTAQWTKALLGSSDSSSLHPACCPKAGHRETDRLAHIPSHVLDFAQKSRSRIQGYAGIDEAFVAAIHTRRLYAGCRAGEARCASCGALTFVAYSFVRE
jgi:integrase